MRKASKREKQPFPNNGDSYGLLVNNSVIGLFETDLEGRFLFVNKKWCDLTAYTEKEATNLNLLELVDQEYKAKIATELANAKNEKREARMEFSILRADGILAWALGILGPVIGPNNEITRFTGALIKIGPNEKIEGLNFSEYNKLLKQVKESERKLAEAQRLAKIGSWEWYIEDDYVSWSEELFNIFEIEDRSVISLEHYFKKIHPEDRDLTINTILDARKEKKDFKFLHRILLKNDMVKFLFCRGEVITTDEGHPLIIRGTAEDVTDRHLSEEAELEKKSQTIEFQATLLELSKTSGLSLNETLKKITEADAKQINTERVGIWLFNEDGSAITCKCLYKKSLKKHSNDLTLLAKDFPNYFNEVKENRAIVIFDALMDATTSELNQSYLKPLGITSMLDVPIRSQGKLLGIVCHEHVGPKREWTMEEQTFASSVADFVALAIESHNRKKAQKELRLLNEKLSVMNEHKDKFISVIAHDLKNPISSIISASTLLLEHRGEFEPEDEERMIRIMTKASKEVYYQLDEFVRIARLKNHTSLFYPEKLQLFKEVNNDIKLVNQIAEQKKVRIVNNISKQVYVRADKIMLKSILQNLLTNAIKYSYKGGEIEIFSETIRNKEKITVRDNGKGISESKQNEMFSDKNIISEKGTVGEKGTGLGLRIVKDFVEKHNGEITVESKEGKGTSISFTLPLEDV